MIPLILVGDSRDRILEGLPVGKTISEDEISRISM